MLILLRVRFINHREVRLREVYLFFSFTNFLIFLSFASICKTLIKRKLILLLCLYFSELALSIIAKLDHKSFSFLSSTNFLIFLSFASIFKTLIKRKLFLLITYPFIFPLRFASICKSQRRGYSNNYLLNSLCLSVGLPGRERERHPYPILKRIGSRPRSYSWILIRALRNKVDPQF